MLWDVYIIVNPHTCVTVQAVFCAKDNFKCTKGHAYPWEIGLQLMSGLRKRLTEKKMNNSDFYNNY